MLHDIAILTGGQVISEEVGLKLENAGARAARPGPQGRHHQGRDHHRRGCRRRRRRSTVASPRSAPRSRTPTRDYDREKLQERLAKLAGGVAVIKAGAATEVELKERKHRIEDAVRNAKAAVEEGIVAGGGVALIQAGATAFDNARARRRRGNRREHRSRRASTAPLKQIALNAGLEPGVVADKVAQPARRPRPQRCDRRVRRPARSGHHRPGQGDPLGAAERSVHRRLCSSPPRPSSPTSPRRPAPRQATRPAAWAAWTSEFRSPQQHTSGPPLRRGP